MSISLAQLSEVQSSYASWVGEVGEQPWFDVLEQFEDANIYQTLSYEQARKPGGRSSIRHFTLKRDGEIVAAAQARIVQIPLLKAGIAYVRWGPLWQRRGKSPDTEVLRQAIRGLRKEFVGRLGLVLRIYPRLFRGDHESLRILEEEGFALLDKERPDRTLLLDVGLPLDQLRQGMKAHWKRNLKAAEKTGLEVIEGTGPELFQEFIVAYQELLARKGFSEPNSIEHFQRAQLRLPEPHKMRILLCKSNGQLCASLVTSVIGNTAIYLFGATTGAGLKLRGSYLLHWKLIESLNREGVTIYDLHGIDPVANPGTYKFKADLCGSNGADVTFMGRFDCYPSAAVHRLIAGGDRLRTIIRNAKKRFSESKEPSSSDAPDTATRSSLQDH